MRTAKHNRFPSGCVFAATLCVSIVAGCQSRGGDQGDAADTSALVGHTWIVEDIAGRGVIDYLQSSLTFESAEAVNGRGGCNRFSGPVNIKGEAIAFGSLASTRMACKPAVGDQETKVFAALDAARRFSIDRRGLLILEDAAGKPVMRLSRKD